MVEILHHSTYALLITKFSLSVFKERIVVCAIHSSLDQRLKWLTYIEEIEPLLGHGSSRLPELIQPVAASIGLDFNFINHSSPKAARICQNQLEAAMRQL
jgi:hypothetical protein